MSLLRIEVREPSQVGEARRAASLAVRRGGGGELEAGRSALVATELATNLLKHGGGGEMLLAGGEAAGGGLACLALDRGPGMADLEVCMRDGYSTAGSGGSGLGAIRRQSRGLEVYTRPGLGTAILAWLSEPPAEVPGCRYGGLSLPYPGEHLSGDGWAADTSDGRLTLLVADGLGHGLLAAEAARTALAAFRARPDLPLPGLLQALHEALRPTRGAAIGIARLDRQRGCVSFGGIGNIAAVLLHQGKSRRMVSMYGTAGHRVRSIRAFDYPASDGPTVVLHSDGLSGGWNLADYPGLQATSPLLQAAVLYRDFNRGRDDVGLAVGSLS